MSDFVILSAGRQVFCRVSPCSWMHPGYGLQVGLSVMNGAPNAATVFAHDKAVQVTHAMKKDEMLKLAKVLAAAKLDEIGLFGLDAKAKKWADALADFAIETARDEEKRAKRETADRAKFKAKGYTHLFTGWVHPAAGDDRMVSAYCMGAPSDADMKKLLRGCTVKNDFRVETI